MLQFKEKNINDFDACRPQEGLRNYRGTFSVMESRIIWWMEFGVVKMFFIRFRAFFYFSLVREEDAPHNSLLYIPQPRRVWNDDGMDG